MRTKYDILYILENFMAYLLTVNPTIDEMKVYARAINKEINEVEKNETTHSE
jgi:hypothetical protein